MQDQNCKSRSALRALCLLLCAASIPLLAVPPATAQSIWELTPYRIEVLIAFAPAPELTPQLRSELGGSLVDRAELLVGATWEITAVPAPPALQPAMISAIESVTLESLPAGSLQSDKVMLLAISQSTDGCRVTARELDVPTQIWSTPVTRPVWQPGKLRVARYSALALGGLAGFWFWERLASTFA